MSKALFNDYDLEIYMSGYFCRISLFIFAFCSIVSCTSTYVAPINEDARAKLFAPDPDRSTVYIYRSEGFADGVKSPILIDGLAVAQTTPRSFIVVKLEPGAHLITSKTPTEENMTILTEAGKNYYIWQEIKIGLLSARSKLHLVDEPKGQAAVRRCTLVQGYL